MSHICMIGVHTSQGASASRKMLNFTGSEKMDIIVQLFQGGSVGDMLEEDAEAGLAERLVDASDVHLNDANSMSHHNASPGSREHHVSCLYSGSSLRSGARGGGMAGGAGVLGGTGVVSSPRTQSSGRSCSVADPEMADAQVGVAGCCRVLQGCSVIPPSNGRRADVLLCSGCCRVV